MPSSPRDPIFNDPDIGSYLEASIGFMVDKPLLENFRRATLDSGLYRSPVEKQLLQSNEFWESKYVADFIVQNQHLMGFRPRQQQPSPTRAKMSENDLSWFTENMKGCRDEELKEKRKYEPWYSGSKHDHQQGRPPIQSGPDFTEFPRLPTPARPVPPSYAICVGKPAPRDPVFAFGSSGEYCPSSDRPATHPAIGSHTDGNVAPVAPMCVAGSSGHYVPSSTRSGIAPVPPSRTANGLVYAFGSSGEHSSSHDVAPPRPAGPSCSSCPRSKGNRFFAQTQRYCALKHYAAPSAPAVPIVNPYTDHPDNFVPPEPARTVQPYVNNLPQAAGTVKHHTNNAPQLGREVSPVDSGYSTNTTPTPAVSPVTSTTPRPQISQNSNPGTNPTFTNNRQIQYQVSQAHPAPVLEYERWIREVAALAQPEIPAQEVIIAAQQMVRAQQEAFAQQEVYTQQEVPVKLEVPELPKPRRGRPPGTGGKYKKRAKKGDIPTAKRAKLSIEASSK